VGVGDGEFGLVWVGLGGFGLVWIRMIKIIQSFFHSAAYQIQTNTKLQL
jgi:hypothetical protein